MSAATETLLDARDVDVRFATPRGPVHAVRGAGFTLAPGETLAIVGESGSGKSALAKAVVRQHAAPFLRPRVAVAGEIRYANGRGAEDLLAVPPARLREIRAREIAIVFQEAMSALNPVLTIGFQVTEALRRRTPGLDRRTARMEAADLLARLGFAAPERGLDAFPHQFSGGMRQRVMLALAAARRPRLLICDEPTTALDVTIQAQLLATLAELQRDAGMAMLFITHDLGIVAQIADRVAVMYAGRIVETAPTAELYARPRHPYTHGLLASLPGWRGPRPERPLTGQAVDAAALPTGCAFAPRCPRAHAACGEDPPPRRLERGVTARCWMPVDHG